MRLLLELSLFSCFIPTSLARRVDFSSRLYKTFTTAPNAVYNNNIYIIGAPPTTTPAMTTSIDISCYRSTARFSFSYLHHLATSLAPYLSAESAQGQFHQRLSRLYIVLEVVVVIWLCAFFYDASAAAASLIPYGRYLEALKVHFNQTQHRLCSVAVFFFRVTPATPDDALRSPCIYISFPYDYARRGREGERRRVHQQPKELYILYTLLLLARLRSSSSSSPPA